jgi:site-specific DNA-adenine methylase
MFSYYGAKTNLVDLYPKPKYDTIIEPFAGSARYSLKHFDKEVILIDKYPVIVTIWKWLQQCSTNDILKLPSDLKYGERFEQLGLSQVETWFLGFVYGAGAQRPRTFPTKRRTTERTSHARYTLNRIAQNLFKIKHWIIIEGEYTDAPDRKATWFIDPPYQHGGATYVKSNRHINFRELGEWCKLRQGQVIVCENTKADWMDFKPVKDQRGSLYTTTEAIWTNEPTLYDNIQLKLF